MKVEEILRKLFNNHIIDVKYFPKTTATSQCSLDNFNSIWVFLKARTGVVCNISLLFAFHVDGLKPTWHTFMSDHENSDRTDIFETFNRSQPRTKFRNYIDI